MYTLLGSIFLFLALFILYFEFQTLNYFILLQPDCIARLSISKQRLVCFLLFLTFAIKIPIFPFHI